MEPILVKFQLLEPVWRRVVVDRPGHPTVEVEDIGGYFIVSYETQEDFDEALNAFGGGVWYEVIDQSSIEDK